MIMKADKSQDLQSASWKLRGTDGVVPVWIPAGRSKKTYCSSKSLNVGAKKKKKKKKTLMPQLKGRQEEGFFSHAGGSAFCSIQGFNWLDEAHPHGWRQSASLSLPIQMSVSSTNTLTDIIIIISNVWPSVWAPHDPVKPAHVINHHIWPGAICNNCICWSLKKKKKRQWSHSVVTNSLRPHGL